MSFQCKFPNVPKEVWYELELQIAENNLEYADNYRAYRVSDGLHFDEFVKRYKAGCCGSYENGMNYNGERWIIGCNYGH
tara:strand:- start:190 stop:426 length:237 start_codon:yes stop_codon:yes gene_type:complete